MYRKLAGQADEAARRRSQALIDGDSPTSNAQLAELGVRIIGA